MNQPQINRKRAYECEHAIEKRCRCRCGGKLHGAARVGLADLDRLPKNDPHYVPKPIDTGLRAIVKVTQERARQKKHKRYIAHLVCGHKVVIPGSRLGPNRSRTHCEKCQPTQVMLARQRRAEGMDKTLMEFFTKQDKLERRRRYKASKFPNGAWHVVDVDEPDYAIGPGSRNEKANSRDCCRMEQIEMNKAELLDENATLRRALHRPERSRFTQRRADLLEENKLMRAELATYAVEIEPEPRRQVKRRLRASRRLRALSWKN